VRSDQLVTVLSAAIFVFVGVDSNHFRFVLDTLNYNWGCAYTNDFPSQLKTPTWAN